MGSPYLLCLPRVQQLLHRCIANIRLEVLQLGVDKADELELRPLSDGARLRMATLLTRCSRCWAYTNCFSTRASSSTILCRMSGIVTASCRSSKSSRCLCCALCSLARYTHRSRLRFGRNRFGRNRFGRWACFGPVETACRAASKTGSRSPPAQ